MPNPLFNALGGARGTQGGPMNMMQAFQQFRHTFQGDPKAEVQKLLTSGRMSQGQLDQLQAMAKQFMGMMGK